MPIRAPIQKVELGELLSCMPGLAHDAAARDSEAMTAPKTMLMRAAPMTTALESTWITGVNDSSPMTVAVAAHQLLATTKPISPRPAPVHAPTLIAVRTRRPSDTGSRTISGSGSTITAAAAGCAAARGCSGAGSGSGAAEDAASGFSSSVAGATSSDGAGAGAGAAPAAGAPPAHAFSTSSTEVPLAVALAAADRCTSVSGTFSASAAAVSSSLTAPDSNWIHL